MMEGTGRWIEMRLEAVNARLRGQGFMLRAVGSHAGSETGRAGTRQEGLLVETAPDSVGAGRGGSRRPLGSEGG